jgi:hypothetical protein
MRRFLVPREILEDRGGGSGASGGACSTSGRASAPRQARINDLRKVVVLPRSQMAADTAELLRLKALLQHATQRQQRREPDGTLESSGAGAVGGAGAGGAAGGSISRSRSSSSGSDDGGETNEAAEDERRMAEALRQLSCYVLSPECV